MAQSSIDMPRPPSIYPTGYREIFAIFVKTAMSARRSIWQLSRSQQLVAPLQTCIDSIQRPWR